jgi:large subunit ribosomal protein L24
MSKKFKKNDKVKVITGKYKGTVSFIVEMVKGKDLAVVRDINMVKKHSKPSKINPEGGIIPKEMPIHLSNLMHIDPSDNSVSRIGYKFSDNNEKVRYLKKTGNIIESK